MGPNPLFQHFFKRDPGVREAPITLSALRQELSPSRTAVGLRASLTVTGSQFTNPHWFWIFSIALVTSTAHDLPGLGSLPAGHRTLWDRHKTVQGIQLSQQRAKIYVSKPARGWLSGQGIHSSLVWKVDWSAGWCCRGIRRGEGWYFPWFLPSVTLNLLLECIMNFSTYSSCSQHLTLII